MCVSVSIWVCLACTDGEVAPITVHPAFEKAACYFNLTMVHVPVDANFACDVVVCLCLSVAPVQCDIVV